MKKVKDDSEETMNDRAGSEESLAVLHLVTEVASIGAGDLHAEIGKIAVLRVREDRGSLN